MSEKCECIQRHELLQQVLDKNLSMVHDNVERGGSTWGNRANVALISLAGYMMARYVMDPANELGAASQRVSEYIKTDLRVFTREVECFSVSKVDETRAEIAREAKQYAVPVLEAAQKIPCENVGILCAALEDAIKRTTSGDV